MRICHICKSAFTAEEWEERHSDPETGEDVHAACCAECHPRTYAERRLRRIRSDLARQLGAEG